MTIDVLVVDDMDAKDLCESMRADFELVNESRPKKDVRFHESHDGQDAIKKVRERSYDLVVLDFQMPGMDGYETAVKLREIRPDIVLAGNSVYWYHDSVKSAGLVVNSPHSIYPILEYISQHIEESAEAEE